MPITKTVTLYEYDELPDDKAKERARDWFREGSNDMFGDFVSYDDFIAICEAMGVEVETRLEGYGREGKTREVPCIYWSGFWSQGDGASFAGTFLLDGNAGASIRAYAPQDETLHAIGDAFDALNAKRPGLSGTIVQGRYGSRYVHSNTMNVDLNLPDDDDEAEAVLPDFDALEKEAEDITRRLADWLYRNLESEYEYRNSDEEVAESIRINEYTFTADGTRED